MKLKNAITLLEQRLGPVKATCHGDWTEYRSVPPGGRTGIEFSMRPGAKEGVGLRGGVGGGGGVRTEPVPQRRSY